MTSNSLSNLLFLEKQLQNLIPLSSKSHPKSSKDSKTNQHNNNNHINNNNNNHCINLRTPLVNSLTISNERFIDNFEQKYTFVRKLGKGSFSDVFLGQNLLTKEFVALKVFDKNILTHNQTNLITREIKIMKSFNHPNIVRLWDTFETSTHFFIVMEYVEGGELFDHIVSHGFCSEKVSVYIISQLCTVVSFIHHHGVCHRDLKPQNLLITKEGVVKIADFGLSKIFKDEDLKTACGTPDYVAPEILKCKPPYTEAVDIWAIGIISYILLCGFAPFWADTHQELYHKIVNCPLIFPKKEWENISPLAKDFILRTVEKDPLKRLSAQQCLSHPWIENFHKSLKKNPKDFLEISKEFKNGGGKKKQCEKRLFQESSSDEVLFREGLV